MKQLHLRNRQRARRLRTDWPRRAATVLLDDLLQLESYELAIHFISDRRMAAMNKQFLNHEGSTDVITFDYREDYAADCNGLELSGEIFISVADAVAQSAVFKRPLEEEIIRYIIHGVLHLRGFDDLTARERKRMKAQENRLLKQVHCKAG